MSKLHCVWHPNKAASNRRKHGVTFEEAATVFDDPLVLLLADIEHGEPRIIGLGSSARERVLLVVTTNWEKEEARVISARKATAHEKRIYEEGE